MARAKIRRISICTAGGDAPGLNAVIRAVVRAAGPLGWEVCGIEKGYDGLLSLKGVRRLARADVRGLLGRGGTILGATTSGDPFTYPVRERGTTVERDLSGRLLRHFRRMGIDAHITVGGDGSLAIAEKLFRKGLRVVGVPKTIDNDLPHTDHCPGYASAIKYCAATVMEVGLDVGSMATDDGSCCVIEVMGRSAGWIAAGTVLAKRSPSDPPHIILLPEVRYDIDAFLARVKEVVDNYRYCIIVAGEGVKNKDGEEIGAHKTKVDAFGHPLLSGAGERIAEYIEERLKTKTRTVKLGYAQRSAAHFASGTDIAEAVACGEMAVRAAVSGISGMMVKIVRATSDRYRFEIGLQPLADIANVEHFVPRDWISEDGFLPNEKFVEYARPLVEGENRVPTEDGLPRYVSLDKERVEKKLPPRS